MDDIATLEQQLVDRNVQPSDPSDVENALRPRLMGEFVDKTLVEKAGVSVRIAAHPSGR